MRGTSVCAELPTKQLRKVGLDTGVYVMDMISKKLLFATVVSGCAIWSAVAANAVTVVYSFSGILDYDATVTGTFFSAQSTGDTFTGTFTYDDATTDIYGGAFPGYAQYEPTGMIETTFSGGTFANTPTPYLQHIVATDFNSGNNLTWTLSSTNCEPSYCGLGGNTGGSFEGSPLTFLQNYIQLFGDNSTSGTAIDPLALSLYLGSLFVLDAGAEYDPTTGTLGSIFRAQGHLTSLDRVSDVPLPAAFPLFAAGLSAMGFLGWRKKRKGFATTARVGEILQ